MDVMLEATKKAKKEIADIGKWIRNALLRIGILHNEVLKTSQRRIENVLELQKMSEKLRELENKEEIYDLNEKIDKLKFENDKLRDVLIEKKKEVENLIDTLSGYEKEITHFSEMFDDFTYSIAKDYLEDIKKD